MKNLEFSEIFLIILKHSESVLKSFLIHRAQLRGENQQKYSSKQSSLTTDEFSTCSYFCYFELAVLLIRSSINKNTQGGTLEVVGTVNVLDVVCANAGNWHTPHYPPAGKGHHPESYLGIIHLLGHLPLAFGLNPLRAAQTGRKTLQWQALWGN